MDPTELNTIVNTGPQLPVMSVAIVAVITGAGKILPLSAIRTPEEGGHMGDGLKRVAKRHGGLTVAQRIEMIEALDGELVEMEVRIQRYREALEELGYRTSPDGDMANAAIHAYVTLVCLNMSV